MKRFAFTVLSCIICLLPLNAQKMQLSQSEIEKLNKTQITGVDYKTAKMNYPRFVGYNSQRGPHKYGPTSRFFVLRSENLCGLGLIDARWLVKPENMGSYQSLLVGKKLGDLLDPETFLVKPEYRDVDVAIYDLVGVVLNKPFHRLFGKPASTKIPIYSGMIYFDELYFKDGKCRTKPEGIQAIIDECQYDYDFGYRQFKVKIGRGHKWMGHDEGLARDIEIIKAIHEHFPKCDILVDPNDGYSVQDCKDFINGIKPARIYWLEEPFEEDKDKYAEFAAWKKANAPDILIADGEFEPKRELCFDLGREGLMNVYCEDVINNGFTTWIELLPKLKAMGMMASPHAWGQVVRSIYGAYLGMAFGGIPTVEGVTCFCESVNLNYTVKNGYFIPSNKPGFGISFK